MRGLDEQNLQKAMYKVQAYFHGSKVTPGTVLAAYMRAAGLSASGAEWHVAKSALDSGANFVEAVHAASDASRGRSDEKAPSSPSWAPELQVSDESCFEDSGPTGVQKTQAMWEKSPSFGDTTELYDSWSSACLSWFPKVCGPGDILGDGAKKLLGQPRLDPVALLVRETAQNSWDARSGDTVRFVINLRKLDADQQSILRTRVFTGAPPALGQEESLSKDELWVLEVHDRGTEGLGGPIRNDQPIDPAQTTRFINLIFNIGAPQEDPLGGGTYGFGKVVGFVMSRCGSLLAWSRCTDGDELQHRLIGTALGKGFEDDLHRYTGRHWWGKEPEGRMGIEPLTGGLAESMGDALFGIGFQGEETGTSLMILDPDMGEDSPADYASKICEAALWNLWPKMVPTHDGHLPMDIEVQFNGQRLTMPAPQDHAVLKTYVDCLNAVRSAQTGSPLEISSPVQLEEVWDYRANRLLGHLAMARFALFDPSTIDKPTSAPFDGSVHHVCLMRHAAELVVRYDAGPMLDQPGYHWAGVFRPIASTDRSFAGAEPAAHDDWVIESLKDRRMKSDVRVSFTRMREMTRAFVAPAALDPKESSDPNTATTSVAEALGSILAGLGAPPDPVTGPKSPRRGRRTRSTRPTLSITATRLEASARKGHMKAILTVLAHSIDSEYVEICAGLFAATDAGEQPIDKESLELTWTQVGDTSGTSVLVGPTYRCRVGCEVELVVEFPSDMALSVDVYVGNESLV